MIRFFVAGLSLLLSTLVFASTIIVSTIEELNAANKKAQPGDIIILKNGIWKDAAMKLTAKGTKEKPVTFRAETPGKVILCGNSSLRIGGDHIIAEGFFFMNGYAGKDAVISFRTDSKTVANNCRVTNTAINSYNNPNRFDENNWVLFYGKNNRLDNCSFRDKDNMGVLLAVILDDDRSRENHHRIENNYFGRRIPLGSNGGEIIRVGVSQHCQFNSNTQIINNLFEKCDGEAEIISIKSGSNLVKGNVFLESQGSVVLRHGDHNTVEDNIFLGNNKAGTGGIRVINKGQWVVNNFLYGCRGIDFRSPLTIMNGIPNSPAHRYVQVTDAVIMNNTFYNCSPVSLCDGSDAERTLPPENVVFANNLFYNTRDTVIYRAFDQLTGFRFRTNIVHPEMSQATPPGFTKVRMSFAKYSGMVFPSPFQAGNSVPTDSLDEAASKRLGHSFTPQPGFSDLSRLKQLHSNALQNTGVKWNWQAQTANPVVKTVTCSNAAELASQLLTDEPVVIRLTGHVYEIGSPLVIRKQVTITGNGRTVYRFRSGNIKSAFIIAGGGKLLFNNMKVDGSLLNAATFISTDSSGPTGHYNLMINNCRFSGFTRENGTEHFFYASKSSFADSLIFSGNTFSANNTSHFILNSETDNKGWYAAEKIVFARNTFANSTGTLIEVYRGGNDESTLGPNLIITSNTFRDLRNDNSLLKFTGVQRSQITRNSFINCARQNNLVEYIDIVRAYHLFSSNNIVSSGKVESNNFVINTNNSIK